MTTPHAKSNAREGDGVAVPLPEPSCHWSPPGGTYGALYSTAELRAYGDAREAAAMQAQQGAEPVAILTMGDGYYSGCLMTDEGMKLPAGKYLVSLSAHTGDVLVSGGRRVNFAAPATGAPR